jgi:hypothetical protein
MIIALLSLFAASIVQVPVVIGTPAAGGGGGGFTPETADFDGASFGFRSAAFTGLPDSGLFTLSVWLRPDDGDGSKRYILGVYGSDGSDLRFLLYRNTGNKIEIEGYDSAGSQLLGAVSNTSLNVASGWTHVLITFDLSDNAKRHIYFDGTEDASVTWSPYSSGNIDFAATSPFCTVGVDAIGFFPFNGAMSEFWADNVYLNDPTKFISGGAPISLGSTGQTPNGSSPAVYYSRSGSGNSWATDSSGNSNTLTVSGTLTSTTPPP